MIKITKKCEKVSINNLTDLHLSILKIATVNIFNGLKNLEIKDNKDFERLKAVEELILLFKTNENEG